MRFLLATFKHETNTFSPVSTDMARFSLGAGSPITGAQGLHLRKGTGTGMGGFIETLDSKGVDFDIAVVAEARPSGPVQESAFEQILDTLIHALKRIPYQAVLLDLHGAMVTARFDDAESEILQRIRAINSTIPIGVTLDMHANVYEQTVQLATVITGYHTYPHVDAKDAGSRAAALIVDTVLGKIKPRLAWSNRPMLPHIMRQGTHDGPNRLLQDECIRLERNDDVLAASVFTGFPHADIHEAGLSVVVCTDDNLALAEEVCTRLCDQAWEARHEFVYHAKPLSESLDDAAAKTQFPVVILDHCDNASSGGTMDTTAVLSEILKRKFSNAVFFAIHDPIAVAQAEVLGVGGTATFCLGGRYNKLATAEPNPSLPVTATVKSISDGKVVLRGPMMAGMVVNMGSTAVLTCNGVDVVVVSNHVEPSDLSYFSTLGFDVEALSYLVLKSRVHWRAGFGRIARSVVEVDGVGVTGSDYAKFQYEKVRRPIFPLDSI